MLGPHWNIIGIVLLFVGVVLLFFFGMPYRTRRGGASYIILERKDEEDLKIERRYDVYGWIGLVLMTLGTAAQIWASILDLARAH